MLNDAQLKDRLQALAQNDFRPSDPGEPAELAPAMLAHIGTTDPVLRDDLIYAAFGEWILHQRALDPETLRGMAPAALDGEHLLYGIGEQGTDSVFTRAFSALLFPLLLIRHREEPYLAAGDINAIKDGLLDYYTRERDRRGFVPEKGWAHSIAHGADALDDLAQCAELGAPDLADILEAVRGQICVSDPVYIYGEDERTATAALAVIGRGLLPGEALADWVQGFADLALAVRALPNRLMIRANVKNFLQSLYFRLRWVGTGETLAEPIEQTLQRISPYYRPAA